MKLRRLVFLIIIIVITFITFIISSLQSATAATPTVSPAKVTTPTTTIIDKLKQIEALKEKIATKVAQLRESEKGGISGVIKSVGETTLTATTKDGDKTISYSEDTIFFTLKDGLKSEPLDWKQASKLSKGEAIAALGYFDSAHTNFAAKYIYIVSSPLYLVGKIAEIDKSNYTITVKEPAGSTLVDIETFSKIYLYSRKSGLVRGGFSKLHQGEFVHIFASKNPKEEDRVSAVKIISLSFGSDATPSATPTKESTLSATPTKK